MNRRDAIKALMSLPATATVTRASLKPSDVIVIECDDILSQEERAYLKRELQKIWPDQKIVVLTRGLRMRIAEGATAELFG